MVGQIRKSFSTLIYTPNLSLVLDKGKEDFKTMKMTLGTSTRNKYG